MGCVLTCFGIRDDQKPKNRLISRSIPFHRKRSLGLKQLPAPAVECEGIGFLNYEERNLPVADSSDREIPHETKFFKSCGAVPENPVEVQKGLSNVIPQTLDEISVSAAQLHDDSINESISAVYSLGVHEFRNSEDFINANESMKCTDDKNDSGVKLELESSASDDSPYQVFAELKEPGSNRSPYPTPLKLTEEMQTPFTVYPATLESLKARTNARVRMQHVYPVLKAVDNLPLQKVLRENSCKFVDSDSSSEHIGKLRKLLPSSAQSGPEMFSSPNDNRKDMSPASVGQPSHDGEKVFFSSENSQLENSNLSHWLSRTPIDDGNNWLSNSATMGNSCSRQTPGGDGSSFGFITAQCSDSRCCISPKLWEGNGIPNTTRKYKEDQEVTWHTTPFEERLHNVLTNDKLLPQSTAKWSDSRRAAALPDWYHCISPKLWDGNGIPNTTTKYKEDQKVTWHTTPFEERLHKVLTNDKLLPQRKLIEE